MSQGQYQSTPPKGEKARHIYSESGDVGKRVKTDAKTSRARGKKAKGPRTKLGKALYPIPYALGIVLCVAILAGSVFIGNARALSGAVGEAMEEWHVSEYVSGRVGEARNLLTLVNRSDVSPELAAALETAIDDLDGARGVSDTMSANAALETAASNASAALLGSDISKSDEKSLSRVMDEFREQGNFLRQQARRYNQEAEEALELYEKLPTRFLLKAPEVAQGI